MRRLLGVLGIALLVLTACGSDDDPAVESSGQSSSEMDHSGMDMDNDKDKDDCETTTASPEVSAESSLAFEQKCVSVPAGTAFTLTFENKETGISHNVAVAREHTDPVPLFKTEVLVGPNTASVSGGPLEAGTYHFHCEVHPVTMQGTFEVA